MYSDNARVDAYTNFLLGESFEQIAEKLKKNYPKITSVTIRDWAKRENWERKKQLVLNSSIEKANDFARASNVERLRKGTKIEEVLYHKIIDSNLEPKSLEGAAYALTALGKFNQDLELKLTTDSSPLLIVQAMLDIFKDVPQVKKAIEKHWPRIEKSIRLKLSGLEPPIEK